MLEHLILQPVFKQGTYKILTAQWCWLVQYVTVLYSAVDYRL